MMYVLTLGSTDTDEDTIAVSKTIKAARKHAVKTLRGILTDIGDEGEYNTKVIPYDHEHAEGAEVIGNVRIDYEDDEPQDWIRITKVPTV